MHILLLFLNLAIIWVHVLCERPEVSIFAIAAEKDKLHITEWIQYHQALGYDHINLLDTTDALIFQDLRQDFVTILQAKGRPVKHQFRVFAGLPRNKTLCTFIGVNEYVVLPQHSSLDEFISELGLDALTRLSTYDVVSQSDQFFPDIAVKSHTLRTKEPVSFRYSGILSEIGSFDDALVPILKNGTILNYPETYAFVFRIAVFSKQEHQWYLEWLCADYPLRAVTVVMPFDIADYTSLCNAVSSLSTVQWGALFDDFYYSLRLQYFAQGLVEDNTAWRVMQKNLTKVQLPLISTEFSQYTEERLFTDLFLTSKALEDPSMVLGSFVYTPLEKDGEEVSEMTVYGDRDVPLQFLHFCIDHSVAMCNNLTNYAIPSFEYELTRNPKFLAGTTIRNEINYDYLNALLHYNYAMRVKSKDSVVIRQAAVHAVFKHYHPEECYRGWRKGEHMMFLTNETYGVRTSIKQLLPTFVMYVLYHDNASLQMMNDALFDGNPGANSNGLIVPVKVSGGVFFEYGTFRDKFLKDNKWSYQDYVGITTYKTIVQYNTLCTYEVKRLLTVAAKKVYDVIPFVRNNDELLRSAVMTHRRSFKDAWDAVLLALGYNISTIRRYDRIKPFYRSSMFIKPRWLEKLSGFMSRAMVTIQEDPVLYAMCSVDAGYIRNSSVTRRVFNSTSYQLFPFLAERFQSFYLAVEGAKVCHGNEDCPDESFW